VCLWRARRESGEWIVGLGCGGVGGLGSEGEKKTLLPCGSFQNCGFQDGVNFVSKFMLKERSA
jgi:hypothetical protein